MRSKWIEEENVKHILAALMPQNALAAEMSYRYGMRIGDVLATKTKDVRRGRWTYTEEKTGKKRRITLGRRFQEKLLQNAGRLYVFEHRNDWKKHRTRQAVYYDIRRAAKAFRLGNGVSPHTFRKVYAVNAMAKYKDLKRVQTLLNHSSEAITMIYALADIMTGGAYEKHKRTR